MKTCLILILTSIFFSGCATNHMKKQRVVIENYIEKTKPWREEKNKISEAIKNKTTVAFLEHKKTLLNIKIMEEFIKLQKAEIKINKEYLKDYYNMDMEDSQ